MNPRIPRTLVACLTILSSAAICRTALADPDASTAVLGLEALDGAPDNVASEITDALRQRVAGTHGFQLVQGKDLVEVKLVFSCPDEATACMAQAGKSMGATKLIFGNVKRTGTDYQVTLKLLDVNRSAIDASTTEAVPRRRAEPTVFRSLAPAWIAKLSGKGGGGTLQIRANVAGAAVSLDGARVGVTGAQPVAIADVAAGQHEVAVEKTGYTTTKQEFTLAPGQSLPLSLSLSAVPVDVGNAIPPETPPVIVRRPGDSEAPEGPPPNEGGGSSVARAGFWVAVVGTAGALAGGLYFAKEVQQINSDLDQYRRIPVGTNPCKTSPTGLCDTKGDPKQPRTAAENSIVASKTDQGKTYQDWEIAAFAIALPAAIASGFFLYKGYLDSGSQKTTASRGLRIFPTASASAGGIVTEFDF